MTSYRNEVKLHFKGHSEGFLVSRPVSVALVRVENVSYLKPSTLCPHLGKHNRGVFPSGLFEKAG